ncbi:hypothetical protein L3X38_041860 [Prunus dulcis]|uniref:Uncharacterized protein n=1 Tax=Prunus dulcis TaxID=3755 RepID=A0AAD4UV52_PRUDU|nr:hypothetical protein L3X38_041860 [Prunus dulcis]
MEEKFDRMFMNTTATGDHAWAPSSGVLPTHDSFKCDGILLGNGDDSNDPVYVPDETIQVTEKFCGKGKKRTNQQLDTQVKKEKNVNRVATKVGKVGGPGSHLWLFATRLFLNQEKRKMFTTMEDPNIKLQWLNYELSEK